LPTSGDGHFMPQYSTCDFNPRTNISYIPIEVIPAVFPVLNNQFQANFMLDQTELSSGHYKIKPKGLVVGADSLNGSVLSGMVANGTVPAYRNFFLNKAVRLFACELVEPDIQMYVHACKQAWLQRCDSCVEICNARTTWIRSVCPSHISRRHDRTTRRKVANLFGAPNNPGEWREDRPLLRQELDKPLAERYITLWLHQVHGWFKADPVRINNFLHETKKAGFTAIMTNVEWAWTEREVQGQYDFGSQRDGGHWLEDAAAMGLKVYIVVSMRDFPLWAKAQAQRSEDSSRFFEHMSPFCRNFCAEPITVDPSLVDDTVASWTTAFFKRTLEHYKSVLGHHLIGVQPNFNNELECRFTQTRDCQRDWSPAMLKKFGSIPASPYDPVWQNFRRTFLASKIGNLCKLAYQDFKVSCFLHFGEFFAGTDAVLSNTFFLLAKSPYVSTVIMDSNMALVGAPSSPSVVGLLVSTARMYSKEVHYEMATERLFPCTDDGIVVANTDARSARAARTLYTVGVKRGLESGVDAIGVTNLCQPQRAIDVVDLTAAKTARVFAPTALIFVPYEELLLGEFGRESLQCWGPEMEFLPTFGGGAAERRRFPHTCLQDTVQYALTEAWDELRGNHSQVAVVGVASMLTPALLSRMKEAVAFSFAQLTSAASVAAISRLQDTFGKKLQLVNISGQAANKEPQKCPRSIF